MSTIATHSLHGDAFFVHCFFLHWAIRLWLVPLESKTIRMSYNGGFCAARQAQTNAQTFYWINEGPGIE